MSYVISWVGTKDGQGLTSTMLAAAYEIARTHSVLVLDADMSGTATAVDHLHLHPQGRGMNNLVGMSKITAESLLRETIRTRHPRVHLVPGLMAIYGTGIVDFVGQLDNGRALVGLPYDFVLIDMGCAWSHPLLDSPRAAAQVVGRISSRVFVLIQDSPTRIPRSIQVLQAAQPPKAELVLMETRHGHLAKQVREVVSARLPSLSIAACIRWDPRRAVQAEDAGAPIAQVGEEVVRSAQIVDRALAFLEATRPGAPARLGVGDLDGRTAT
jgi:MinD-like ATPase involved in chromosome partitioning or flagellar assembly